jgi:carbonic anhydrase
MKRLIDGLIKFRREVRQQHQDAFARVAVMQRPTAFFIGCADSRVSPQLLLSTQPGEVFVLRNVGNLVPPYVPGHPEDRAALAALEFALTALPVTDVVVCGHSGCGAMRAALAGGVPDDVPHLREWLRHVEPAMRELRGDSTLGAGLSEVDRLGQLNVLKQLEHLRTHPLAREREAEGRLRLHGLWFDIPSTEVTMYSDELRAFVPVDEEHAELLLRKERTAAATSNG